MLALNTASYAFAPTVPAAPVHAGARATVSMETPADLKKLAEAQNPILGFWDPMNLVEYDQFSQGQEASIGFLRHAEIKHGRVAMAAFVGYIVQSNGIHFPWDLANGVSFGDISAAGGPPDQWDALPTASKLQILGFIGFLEWWGENSPVLANDGEKHYMRGGKPGYFPSWSMLPHPVPLNNLWDPFGFSKKLTPEQKANKLNMEINNGRFAMIGIMGVLAASKGLIVPGLDSLPIAPYAGEIMAPFSASDTALPYVADMLSAKIW